MASSFGQVGCAVLIRRRQCYVKVDGTGKTALSKALGFVTATWSNARGDRFVPEKLAI
jgi:hypothetical protein